MSIRNIEFIEPLVLKSDHIGIEIYHTLLK